MIDLVVNNSTNSIVNKFVNSIFQIIHVVNNFVNQNTNNSITQIDSNFVNQKSISTNSTFRNQFDMTINDWQNIEFSQQQWNVLQKLIVDVQTTQFIFISSSSITNNDQKWNTSEIDFFDFIYEIKFVVIENLIKYFDKNIYFRDVDIFIDRVKNMIVVKNVELFRQNFYICFRDIIFAWYTSILIENQKRLVKLNDNVDE